ncbi:MAG: hypothetical protein IT445_13990 [Phycisphaeraceae bacterium]|nr:hypothetical protein [Phycisphaeraceae bacterium]
MKLMQIAMAMLLLWSGALAQGPTDDAAEAEGQSPTPPAAETDSSSVPAEATQENLPGMGAEKTADESASAATSPGAGTSPAGPGVPLPAGAKVAIIPIEDMIYDFTLASLQRRIERALDGGATVIVLELDTYGGEVTAAIEISKYIKSLNVPVIAWVNDKAYSAGTMIAAACDQIIMADGATLGDSAPIAVGQNLEPTERAKALSPILEEYRDDAQRRGYDFALFHAMCELGIEVYQIRHKDTGEIRHVNQSDYAVMVQGADPDVIAAGAPGSGSGAAGVIGQLFGGRGANATNAGNTAPALEIATSNDRGKWVLVKKVHDGRTLLTLNQTRAQDVGIARQIVRNQSELRQYTGAAQMQQVGQTWSEGLAGFLTHPAVRAILIIALLLGGYAELQSPGVGLPGAVALIALVLLLGAPYLMGLAEIWHILLFLIGFFLLLVEVLFTPGFGLLGIAGIAAMLVALVISVVPLGGQFFPAPGGATSRFVWDRLLSSSITMLLSLIVSFVGFYFLTRYFGSIPLLNKLVLEDASPAQMPQAHRHVSGDEQIGGGRVKVGDTGKAVTSLHPAGEAIIDGSAIDVVALGGWIDQGAAVRVVEVHGNRIVVDLV